MWCLHLDEVARKGWWCRVIHSQSEIGQKEHHSTIRWDLLWCPAIKLSAASSKSYFLVSFIAAVVLAFFLCWAPFHAQRLGYVYFKESKIFRTLNEYLYYISGFLYYLSATVNPILYNLMSLKYRHAFKQTLCSRKRRRGDGVSGDGGAINATTATGGPLGRRSYTFKSSSRTGWVRWQCTVGNFLKLE